MDAHEPPSPFPRDADLPRGWTHGWTFRLDSASAPRPVPVDADTVATARAAARAMQEALLEAQRQSLLVDAAVATLVEQGSSAAQVAGDVGLSVHTADDLVGGMPMLESVCRDVVAHAEGHPRWERGQPPA